MWLTTLLSQAPGAWTILACMAARAAPPASTNAVRGCHATRPTAGPAVLVLVLIGGQF